MTAKTMTEKIKFEREVITCKLPVKVIQQLTSLGKKIKKENGVVFANPLEVAICTLMSKGLGG